MEFIVTPNSFKNAKILIKKRSNAILLSLEDFSCRSNYYFKLEEIKELCDIKETTKVFVKLNNFIFEDKIQELEKVLITLSKLNIDKLFFNDFAIPQIKFEKGLSINLHYHPETLVTSYGQFDFFRENDILSLSLSNELFSHEIHQILKNKKNMSICIQGHGYSFIMHSRWEMITNFQKYINDSNNEYEKDKIIFIREHQKVYPNIIIEDKYGTHMFSGYKLCLFNFINELANLGLDYLLLDTYLEKEVDYDIMINDIYHDALKANSNIKKSEIFFKDDSNYSPGFYGGINSILHFKKVGEKNEK